MRSKSDGEISYSDSSGNMAKRRSRVETWDSSSSGGRGWVEVMVVVPILPDVINSDSFEPRGSSLSNWISRDLDNQRRMHIITLVVVRNLADYAQPTETRERVSTKKWLCMYELKVTQSSL